MSLVAEELDLSSSTDPSLQDSPTQRIPSSHNDDNEGNDETNGVEITISLPRDILTAYFLLRLQENIWSKYHRCGKIGIYICLFLPFFIQYLILVSLLRDMNISEVRMKFTGDQLLQNLVAITVLFIYMLKDVIAMYHGLWRYLNFIEIKAGAYYNPINRASLKYMRKRIIRKRFRNRNENKAADEKIREEEDIQMLEIAGHEFDDDVQHTMSDNIVNSDSDGYNFSIGRNLKFIEFRVWFFIVLAMYAGFAFYSLVQIGTADTIVAKLGVALGIFFVLEMDDWTYVLFIAQNGILDDAEFDVQIWESGISLADKISNDQKKLWLSLIFVFTTIGCVWGISIFM